MLEQLLLHARKNMKSTIKNPEYHEAQARFKGFREIAMRTVAESIGQITPLPVKLTDITEGALRQAENFGPLWNWRKLHQKFESRPRLP